MWMCGRVLHNVEPIHSECAVATTDKNCLKRKIRLSAGTIINVYLREMLSDFNCFLASCADRLSSASSLIAEKLMHC